MKNRNIREKKHRLPHYCYKGRVRITFTLCVEKRENFFTKEEMISKVLDILREVEDEYDCKNWVYVFMPNHLHMIVEGKSEKSDLWKALVLFKQKTGFYISQNTIGIKWQKDFYDRIHRKDEDLKKQIIYLLNNPERKGLVNNWRDYPFKGSLDFNLEEIIA